MLTKENLWQRIKENEGEVFYTVRDKKPFAYTVHDSYIIVKTSRGKNMCITLKDFKTAFDLHPRKPGDIHEFFTASYIVALFKDERMTY